MDSHRASIAISAGHYAVFRALFGAYLAVHFGYLALYAAELFSSAGMLAEGGHSPLFAFAPSLLHISDAPWFVRGLTGSGVVAALAFAAGRWHRVSAAWMLLLLISLFARNPLIANPALPYVGFMLLAHLFTAGGRSRALPSHLFVAVTIVLCVSYSYSGYTKLLSPSWVAGDTVSLVLHNPLARDWFVRDLVLLVPDVLLQSLTWFILSIELLFAPLFLIGRLRPWLWGAMLAVQFGFLLLLRFPDLTLPMLLFHLLTFDGRWLPARRLGPAVLHYDGECGVCHKAVGFALAEVADTGLRFRPLQVDGVDVRQVTSWRLEEADTGSDAVVYLKTAAVIRLLEAGGGLWRVLACLIRLIPRPLRDAGYDLLARSRRRLAAKPAGLCPLVAPETAARFMLSP